MLVCIFLPPVFSAPWLCLKLRWRKYTLEQNMLAQLQNKKATWEDFSKTRYLDLSNSVSV